MKTVTDENQETVYGKTLTSTITDFELSPCKTT